MFEAEPRKKEKAIDYTGPIIVAMIAPVFLIFVLFHKADMGLAACIGLGMAMFAIKLHWKLRKHFWFWAIIILILAVQVPLLSIVQWPQGKTPTLVYAMPVGIAEFLLIMGAIGLAEKFFSKGSSSSDDGDGLS